MKIALTVSGNDLNSPMDPRFGRAAKFLVFDIEAGSFDIIDNRQNLDAAQGAGIQAAEQISRLGAGALVTGHCGPKAFRVLSAAGVKVYNTDAATVAEALARFRSGGLKEASSADVEGHWA